MQKRLFAIHTFKSNTQVILYFIIVIFVQVCYCLTVILLSVLDRFVLVRFPIAWRCAICKLFHASFMLFLSHGQRVALAKIKTKHMRIWSIRVWFRWSACSRCVSVVAGVRVVYAVSIHDFMLNVWKTEYNNSFLRYLSIRLCKANFKR